MVTLYTDPRMLGHRPRTYHPERPERLAAIVSHLQATGLDRRMAAGAFRPATDQELSRVHRPAYLAEIEDFERRGGGLFESDTYIVPGSILAARLAAGAAIAAVAGVIEGEDRRAVGLIRPPGHHARPSTAMGFCVYSTIAVAAAQARHQFGLDRILIVDFDVHHGNGTQEVFYDDPTVAFLSIHRWPFYPGTGRADETGTGDALGLTRNLPVPLGITRDEYRSAFRNALADLADKARPQLVLLSAGFDAHVGDPVGGLCLEVEDFETLTRDVVEVAEAHAGGRVVSLLEGGYDIDRLPHAFEAHLRGLGVTRSPE